MSVKSKVFWDLLNEFPLSRFDLSIQGSFSLLILIVDGLFICTVNERELVWKVKRLIEFGPVSTRSYQDVHRSV